MDRIAVLTSGGDAPGMNDAIRGVVRTGLQHGLEVIGFQRGYEGLVRNEHVTMDSKSVGSILEEGGTILRTYRSKRFREPEGQKRARENLNDLGIDALVVIGGDGSLRGAHELDQIWEGSVAGVPATIDNDLAGTDHCLGFDTAVNTALDALDNVRDTASSHERTFILEVMGRDSGHLALNVGLAGGAEEILIPEREYDTDAIAERIDVSRERGKLHYIIVLAEGAGRGFTLSDELQEKTKRQTRVVVLGHVQRGGSPTARDRIAGGKMGFYAVRELVKGKSGICVGIQEGSRAISPLPEAVQPRPVRDEDVRVARTLST